MRKLTALGIATVLLASTPALAEDGLTRAYQKEFTFLQAEKEALQARKDKVQAEARRDQARMNAEIGALQRRLIAMRERADSLDTELREAADAAARAETGDDVVGEILLRAGDTLRKNGMEPPPPVALPVAAGADDADAPPGTAPGVPREVALQTAFTRGLALVERNGIVRVEKGQFFTADGNKVVGQTVHIGAIATYGVSGSAAGPLIPAGAGHLTLHNAPAPDIARALASGERPAALTLFLHESLEKPITPEVEKTLGDFLRAGGIIGWVIVGLGVLALLMLVARAWLLAASSGGARFVAEVEHLVAAGKTQSALALAVAKRGPAARVLTATLKHLDHDREQLEDMVGEALLGEQSKLERFGSAITASAAVAPLLGLLGTVAGMIATFDIITTHGTGDPKMLSGGISEALVTTELGLIVAIPTLLIGSVLVARAEAITTSLERAALRVMNAAVIARHEASRLAGPTRKNHDRRGPTAAQPVTPVGTKPSARAAEGAA